MATVPVRWLNFVISFQIVSQPEADHQTFMFT